MFIIVFRISTLQQYLTVNHQIFHFRAVMIFRRDLPNHRMIHRCLVDLGVGFLRLGYVFELASEVVTNSFLTTSFKLVIIKITKHEG